MWGPGPANPKFVAVALCLMGALSPAIAQSGTCTSIQVGEIVVDPATFLNLGFSLPIASGDSNYNASVTVEYRRTGTSQWKSALPMLRVRPETISDVSPPPSAHPVAEQFAGSVMNLEPDTSYDVRFHLTDPDGCDQTFEVTTRTRKEPPAMPANPRAVSVSSLSELNNAIAQAQPGDVITLARGVHRPDPGDASDIAVLVEGIAGTFENPIIIRGESREETIIDAGGKQYCIRTNWSDYIHIEDLTIRNGEFGIRLTYDTTGVVIHRTIIRNVTKGIWTKNHLKRDLTICDNDLQGPVQFPQTDSSTWDYEGIVLHGGGGVVCYNTIAGFGDALGFSKAQEADLMPPHRGNDFYGNDVLWSGDDCFEFDYSERNNRAFRNRCTNTANGISAQPVFGGPAYAYENIVYNLQKASQIKPNNQPSGVMFYHNLFGLPWFNYSGSAYNIDIRNNLWVGVAQAMVTDVSTRLLGGSVNERAIIDYNGWSYDGRFRLGRGIDDWRDHAAMRQGGYFEANGRILSQPIFFANIPFAAEAGVFQDPIADASLHPDSNAVNAGTVLPNINDGYKGVAPDLGPYELGTSMHHYGIRGLQPLPPDDTPPSTPQNVTASPATQSQIDLAWEASTDDESGVDHYLIYRDGQLVGQPAGTTYSDTELVESTTYGYQISAVNRVDLESGRSTTISASTLVDTTSPTIDSVVASGDPNQVIVRFSEPVEQASATASVNYQISNGIVLLSAALDSEFRTVTLTTSGHTNGVSYTLSVSNVRDRASTPNTITSNTQVPYTYVGDLVILNLGVASGDLYEVVDGLNIGSLAYIDRSYVYDDVPPDLIGSTYIKTSNGDKNFEGTDEFLVFDVNQDVTVYVAHDDRYSIKPSWLSSFANTGLTLSISGAGDFELFAKAYPSGTVTLGVNQDPAESESNSMYTVIIVRGTAVDPGDPPSPPQNLQAR